MKNLLLLFTLISLTVFAACDKQQVEVEITPTIDDPAVLTSDFETAKDLTRTPSALTVNFTIDHQNGSVSENEMLQVSNQSSNAVAYEWDFGNGDKSTEANPAYQYKIHGNYTVTLKATDAFGQVQQASQDIVVLCIFGGGPHEF